LIISRRINWNETVLAKWRLPRRLIFPAQCNQTIEVLNKGVNPTPAILLKTWTKALGCSEIPVPDQGDVLGIWFVVEATP